MSEIVGRVLSLPDAERSHLNRITELEAALRTAFAAMAVAQTIDAVRAEYDFEPAIRQAASALRKE